MADGTTEIKSALVDFKSILTQRVGERFPDGTREDLQAQIGRTAQELAGNTRMEAQMVLINQLRELGERLGELTQKGEQARVAGMQAETAIDTLAAALVVLGFEKERVARGIEMMAIALVGKEEEAKEMPISAGNVGGNGLPLESSVTFVDEFDLSSLEGQKLIAEVFDARRKDCKPLVTLCTFLDSHKDILLKWGAVSMEKASKWSKIADQSSADDQIPEKGYSVALRKAIKEVLSTDGSAATNEQRKSAIALIQNTYIRQILMDVRSGVVSSGRQDDFGEILQELDVNCRGYYIQYERATRAFDIGLGK